MIKDRVMIKLTSFGAVRGVTGSCHLLETSAGMILVDCGMFQGARPEWNKEAFGFDPKAIQAVFVTHPHADHVGRLPKLVKEGFTGPVYMIEACRPLSRIVLEDSAHLLAEESEDIEGEEPLFTAEDVARLMEQVKTVGYHHVVDVFPGVRVSFHDAGHVLGSAFISVEVMDENEQKTIVFSGDIGNDHVPILPSTEGIVHADVVVCEATYGDRLHEDTKKRHDELKAAIEHTVKTDGVLLIPAFSIERTQEVLYELNNILLHDLKTDIPIYLDSPMAIRATQVYRDFKSYLRFDAPIFSDPDRDFFSFPNLRETLSRDASKAINEVPAPKVIIAGSGMMSGGRILHHLLRYLDKPSTTLLLVGYQAEGTLGRQIQDGAKHVRIFGQSVAVRAQLQEIHAFSAHGDRDKLTRWLKPEDGHIPNIFLVHGDADQKVAFKAHLEQELGATVLIPHFGESTEV